MFGFLKDKLKGALGKLTKEVEKEAVVEKKEIIIEKKPEKKEEKASTKIAIVENIAIKEEVSKVEEKKKGFFQKIFGKKDEEEIIEDKENLRKIAEHTITITQKTETKIEKKEEKQIPIQVQTTKKEFKTLTKENKDKSVQNTESKILIQEKKIETKAQVKPIPVKPIIDKKEDKIIITKNIETAKPIENIEKVNDISKAGTVEIKNIKKEIEEEQIIEDKIASKENIVTKPQKEIKVEKAIPKIIEKSRSQILEEERLQKSLIKEKVPEEPKGFFTKITETFTKIKITEEKFEEIFWELEVVLLENNVAVEVIDKIKRDLKRELMTEKVSRKSVEDLVLSTLKQSIIELFDVEKINLIENIKNKRKSNQPYIISIIGVNGSGKTTSIAKLAHKFQKEGLSVVLAASDTFRAAAIQQLEEHANRLEIKIIKHDYNSDPAAVAFDAIKYAEAKNIDVVLIDTAGRLHSNTNLMRELEKVIRVCKPDIKIFVGESITGNDCVEQAKEFDKAVGIDAIILAKADVDDKGGAAISVSYILKRPILYLGTGQTYDDLKEFDSDIIIKSLEL
jgi:fused signal recognition particle receptor